MKLIVELTKDEIKQLIHDEIARKFNGEIDVRHIQILTKSAQNYKSEWEQADIKVIYNHYK